MRHLVVIAALLVAVGTAAAFVLTPRWFEHDLGTPFDQHTADWATSRTCGGCHQDQYASWHRTFHRTMTQEANEKTVLGRFDGRAYTWWGQAVRPVRRDDGYWFDYLDADGQILASLQVQRTVGSHRYQQYLAQKPNGGETYYRIHLLWHMEDERWVHVNGIFLSPDEQSFDAHVAVWDHNCIFCHNTGPEPHVTNWDDLRRREKAGEPIDSAMDAQYDSEVAELGISCETCHGPGSEHAQRNRNPLRRYLLALGDADDPTITHPGKLDKQRAVDVCGQCHGQRTPPAGALHQWITTGPTFRVGDRLAGHVETVWRDMPLPQGIPPDLFRLRFWPDGTARLSAYEYQGVLQSKCFDAGELTCSSCHTAHGGSPHGMIREQDRRGNARCLACHDGLADDVEAHTKHAADSSGSVCYECHMPRLAYGVMTIHRSHRIEVPDPGAHTEAGRPNACTNCHLDRSPVWAAQKSAAWWGDRFAEPDRRRDGAPTSLVDSVASLHAGDPVQRAVAAKLAGRADSPLSLTSRAFLVPQLMLALEDNYPSTRKLARESLVALIGEFDSTGGATGLAPLLADYDFIGPAADRTRLLEAMRARWSAVDKSAWPPPPDGSLVGADYHVLRAASVRLMAIGHSDEKRIDIGE